MKLTLSERIILLGILPAEGDFTTLGILRNLRENLSLTEEENKEHEVMVIPNPKNDGSATYQWKPESAKIEFEIEIGDKAKSIVKEQLLKLDKEKKMLPQHMSLYEKFVQEKEGK